MEILPFKATIFSSSKKSAFDDRPGPWLKFVDDVSINRETETLLYVPRRQASGSFAHDDDLSDLDKQYLNQVLLNIPGPRPSKMAEEEFEEINIENF